MSQSILTRRSFGAAAIVTAAQLSLATPVAKAQSSRLDTIKKRGALRIGWGIWVPYMFVDPKTRKTTGITVSLGNALAEELGVRVEFVETSWSTMVAGLQAGQYDVTMPYLVTEERSKVVTFSEPVFKSNWGLMVPRNKVSQYRSWEDLNKPGVRVSATLGSSAPRFMKLMDKAQHLLMKDGSDSIAQLLTGQADAWLSQYDAFRVAEKQQPNLAVVPGPALGQEDVALAVPKDDVILKAALDKAIVVLKTNGKLLSMIKEFGLDQTSIAA
ncbi:substrate-binding periplasmic protein [Comamonas testosteroni]|uniref:substrate-binding periplasmic protein n=1 Tax=Comamonas testosteroni TaxID=285 RepID=UPI00389A9220